MTNFQDIRGASDDALVRSEVFGSMSPSVLSHLNALAQTVVLEKDAILFMQGDPADAIYSVEEGSIEISILAESGKKLTLNVMHAPEVFGEIAALDGGPRTATATASKSTRLKKITRTDIFRTIETKPEFAAELIEVLCERIRWISQQVEDLAMANIEKRLARKILLLSQKFADADGVLQMAQGELADFLGVTRESVNKALKIWSDAGIVSLARGSVTINDRLALDKIANAD